MSKQEDLPFWQKHVVQWLIVSLLGGLVTLATISGGYLLDANRRLREVAGAAEKSLAANRLKASSGFDFVSRISSVIQKSSDRLNYFDRNWSKPGVWRQEAARKEAHQVSALNRKDAAQDLAALGGYSSDKTGLGEEFHQLAPNIIKNEIAVWESFDRYIEVAGGNNNPVVEEGAFQDVTKGLIAVHANVTGFGPQVIAVIQRFDQMRKENDDDYRKSIDGIEEIRQRVLFAGIGFGLSLVSFCVLGFFAWRWLSPKRATTRILRA